MEQSKKLIVGLDLCNDFSQISCYSFKTFEPISISQDEEENHFLIPTVLCKNSDHIWTFGYEAIIEAKEDENKLINDLFGKIKEGSEFVYDNEKFKGIDLLEKFIRRILMCIKKYFPNELIANIVITTSDMNKDITNAIREVLEKVGIFSDRAKVISHSESYIYYTLSMDKALWVNDVALFDFSSEGFYYYQISMNRRNNPMVVAVSKKDFTEVLDYSMIYKNNNLENIDYILENILSRAMYKQLISTVYFTGEGFEGGWANNVIQSLCKGRRVFMGRNIYTKGACYAAKEMSDDTKFNNYMILSSEMITYTVSFMAYHQEKYDEIFLIKEPILWQNVDNKLEVILDEQNEIEFQIRNLMSRELIKTRLILDELPDRPNKVTRLSIHVRCLNENKLKIEAMDLGFGELYQGSNKVWSLEVDLP